MLYLFSMGMVMDMTFSKANNTGTCQGLEQNMGTQRLCTKGVAHRVQLSLCMFIAFWYITQLITELVLCRFTTDNAIFVPVQMNTNLSIYIALNLPHLASPYGAPRLVHSGRGQVVVHQTHKA